MPSMHSMPSPTVAPYGTWQSPITVEDAAAAGGGPAWVDTFAGEVWWSEGRPAEGGRVAVVRCRAGQQPVDVLAVPWNARNRVHEYGGRPFGLVGRPDQDPVLVFTNWADQRLYRLDVGRSGPPRPLTPEPERPNGLRYAAPAAAGGGTEVWCVRETFTGDAPTDVRRDLVAVPLDGSAAADPDAVRVLGTSHRFLSDPRPSPDGRLVAWIGWDHPSMPWDGTELCVAEVTADGTFGSHRVLAGGPAEAVCQVEWDSGGDLLALTDPTGWWNLYRITLDGRRHNLAAADVELGGPLWRPGMRWFAPLGDGRYAVLRSNRLAVLDETTGSVTDVDTELTSWWQTLRVGDGWLAGTASSARRERTAVAAEVAGLAPVAKLVELSPEPPGKPAAEYLPVPTERLFPGPDGVRIPAMVYPPTNPDFAAPDGELPPYLVHVHGGPTGRSSGSLDMEIAFFTSRGFGLVAPNYGGSTGYGRAYRERLREQWGVVDVADCAAVASALVAEGTADPDRLVIRGGSAGGWTTAVALIAGQDGSQPVYRCGTSMYPILDLLSWASGETHDLESQYLHSLVGPLPQTRDRYLRRSPSSHPERLARPILLLQGLDDQICPPAQAERFVAALAGSGIKHAYLAFDGEQHGFRRAATIQAALQAELSFYGQVLGFQPAGTPHLELSS